MRWNNVREFLLDDKDYWKIVVAFVIGFGLCTMLAGCIEVGGSTADVCSGTECGTHDESDNSTDNTDNSTSE